MGSLILILVLTCGCNRFFRNYQLKAIQAGVQVDLNLFLQTEKDFHKRFGFYTTDLGALRIAPENALYKLGFTKAASLDLSSAKIRELKKKLASKSDPGLQADLTILEKLNPNAKDLDAVIEAHKDWIVKYSPVTQLEKINFAQMEGVCADCTATAETFKALAVAHLDNDPTLDIWTIDETGKIQHLSNGLR